LATLPPQYLASPILPARDTGFVPQGKFIMFWCFIPYNKSFMTKLIRSRWLDIGLVLFFACLWTSNSSRAINTQKKLGQYPAILTWRLVNNPYIQSDVRPEPIDIA